MKMRRILTDNVFIDSVKGWLKNRILNNLKK